MDICSYLNSKDVAEHCRKINHSFNALESVFIIYHCKRISVEVKHRLYRKIMRNMTDMPLSKHQRPRWKDGLLYPESLFAALREFISNQEQMLQTLKTSNHAVFSYEWTGKGYEPTKSRIVYSDFEKAKLALSMELYEGTEFSMNDLASCGITMNLLDEPKSITVEMNADWKFIFVDSIGFSFDSPLFQNFYAFIPTPFHKGDILINPWSSCPSPFVLDHIHYEGRTESFLQHMKSNWDETDLLAWGFDNMDELISDTPCEIWGYHDLEYYRGEVSPEIKQIQAKIRANEV